MNCPVCGNPTAKNGHDRNGEQKYKCSHCGSNKHPNKSNVSQISKNMENPNLGISLSEFREKNDDKVIIQKGLKLLKKGMLYTTADFKVLAGIRSNFGSTTLMEMKETEGYHGKCATGVYWGHPEEIMQLKHEMILR